jgi:uncharacterized repeat protein (TIGR01451 family)
MHPNRKIRTATFLLFNLLMLAVIVQPNNYVSANASSFHAPANSTAQPDVGVHIEASGSAFMPGDAITFTITISNSGTDIASGIVVTDIVPSQILMGSFTSTLEITATNTITYRWTVEPLSPGEGGVITLSGQIDPALPANFTFINAATITDPNDTTPNNNASQFHVGRYFVFLPQLLHNWPPVPSTPSVNPIDNAGRYSSYVVSWSASTNADTYTLQRDTVSDFAHPSVIYDGTAQYFEDNVGATAGIYYYRVRANNSWGNHSQWSNSTSTLVHYSDVWIYNETGAAITIEIVGVAKRDFAPGTYMWLSVPFGTYTLNTWTSQYYYHVTYQINLAAFNLHIGS